MNISAFTFKIEKKAALTSVHSASETAFTRRDLRDIGQTGKENSRYGTQFAHQGESWIRLAHCHYITARSESQSRFYL